MMRLSFWLGGLALLAGFAGGAAERGSVAEAPSPARGRDNRYISWREHRIDDEALSGVPLRGADGLVMRDLDGDGRRDIVAVYEDSSHVRIAFATRDRNRWECVTLAEGPLVGKAEDVDVGDVNRDGRPDLVVACERGHVIYFEAPARPRDPQAWKHTVLAATLGRGSWIRVKLADMDGDGRLDIVAANKGREEFSYFTRRGAATEPRAWKEFVVGRRRMPINLTPVDLDRDGDLDLVACSRGERMILYFQNGGDGLHWKEYLVHAGDPPSDGFMLQFVDLDEDGRLDILTEGDHDGRVFWLRQTYDLNQLWTPHTIGSVDPDNATGLGFEDINGDGRRDLIVGGYSGPPRVVEPETVSPGDRCGRLAWFMQPLDPFKPWPRFDISRRRRGMFDMFIPIDLNHDHRVDFITTRGNSGSLDGLVWLEQVRTVKPTRAFVPAREQDSQEVPLR